ncbi:MAG: glycosyltransferase family 2 protein [Deltaproteobacteria bacterium]|nr:glycosyltransferase family 2 protein [Deltaproteobacteria bacterium]
MKPEISLIIPVYNEQENIPVVFDRVCSVLVDESFEVIFIDDGSTDHSLKVLQGLSKKSVFLKVISFSRNFGHQSALKAGLDYAQGNCVISLDCDLEHPPHYLTEMLSLWRQGADVVITQREQSLNLSFFKRVTSKGFYSAIRFLSDIPIDPGTADFRLLDRRVVESCKSITENELFWRGIIPWLGFKTKTIRYSQAKRQHGESKYTLTKMIKLSVVGITSFSVKPLHLSLYFGAALSVFSFIYLAYAIYVRLFTNLTLSGWASVIASILLIGGVQLVILGVFGIYLGKLFIQAKGRPQYIVRETLGKLD